MAREKSYWMGILGLLFVLALILCGTQKVEAAKIGLNAKRATVYVDQTVTLKMEGTKKKVSYSSEDTSVATVSKKGTVYGKKPGKTTVTAKVGDQEYSCKVTVVKVTEKTYNYWISKMAQEGRQAEITEDLNDYEWSWRESEVGQTCSMMPLYTEEGIRYIAADLNGDGTLDWMLFDGSHIYVFTVHDNKVKTAAVIRGAVDFDMPPEVSYQESTGTFTVSQMVEARTSGTMVFKLKDGVCEQVTTLHDSVGQMEADGSVPHYYFKNGKQTTEQEYMADDQKYCQGGEAFIWGP